MNLQILVLIGPQNCSLHNIICGKEILHKFTVCVTSLQVIFVVVGLLRDCRPEPQIILPLGGKKFPLGGIFAAQLQC
jgi:hypothetical protein